MFKRFYNLSSNPFAKSVASRDAFPSADLKAIHDRLDYLLASGGIGLITADPGIGKTFAVRTWAEKQNPNVVKVVYMSMTTVSATDFYRQLCESLGLVPAFRKVDMFRDLQAQLRNLCEEKRMRVMVVVDEAQYLQIAVLRDLKMLTNFDMDSRDCFALLLIGQPVLAQALTRQPSEALRQRIVVSYAMEGVNEEQAAAYVREMLRKAGGDPDLFDPAALAGAYAASGRSLRRLNAIVVNALMIGAQQQASHIDAEMVVSAAQETALL